MTRAVEVISNVRISRYQSIYYCKKCHSLTSREQFSRKTDSMHNDQWPYKQRDSLFIVSFCPFSYSRVMMALKFAYVAAPSP